MKHAYTIQASIRDQPMKTLQCTTAWVAFEQRNRLVRQGWKVHILNRAGKPVTDSQLEAAAQAETGAPANSSDEPRGVPISARNLLMGS